MKSVRVSVGNRPVPIYPTVRKTVAGTLNRVRIGSACS